jgi:hypothetical protein
VPLISRITGGAAALALLAAPALRVERGGDGRQLQADSHDQHPRHGHGRPLPPSKAP